MVGPVGGAQGGAAGAHGEGRPGAVRVALFVTCLVDQLFPQVGEAAVAVLRRAGVEVTFPRGQTCCGQVAFNAGFWPEARPLARRLLRTFAAAEVVVAPGGSCVTMVRQYYPLLLREDPQAATAARALGRKTYELSQFLVDVLGCEDLGARFPYHVTYHPSCHALRGLGVRDQPLRLLRRVRDLHYCPLPEAEECCGFGGLFAVKFADLSAALLDAKVRAIEASGAEVVTAVEISCLAHIGGALRRRGSSIRALHLAEVLAAS